MLEFLYFSLAVAAWTVTIFFALLCAAVASGLLSALYAATVPPSVAADDEVTVDLADPRVDADYWQQETANICPVVDPGAPCCGKPSDCEYVPATLKMPINKEQPRGA